MRRLRRGRNGRDANGAPRSSSHRPWGVPVRVLAAAAFLLPVASCGDGPAPTQAPAEGSGEISARAAASSPSPSVVVDVTATDLGTLGGDRSVASDVNSSGVAVGKSETSGGQTHAFRWERGAGITDLTGSSAVFSRATGINASGQISGVVQDPAGSRNLPAVWDGGVRTMLPVRDDVPGETPNPQPVGFANDINDAGVVTGSIDLAGCVWTSFSSDCQVLIGPPQFTFSPHRGNAINDKTDFQIVGRADPLRVSMLWNDFDDAVFPAGDFGVGNGDALGLNDRQPVTVVGWSTTPPPPKQVEERAYMWTQADGITDLGTFGGEDSRAFDVNDREVIVGWARTSDGRKRPFVWRSDLGLRDLGTLGGDEGFATAINGSNQIVGASETSGGETHATLWEVTFVRLVALDVKPGSETNPVNPSSRGVLPVAVLTTSDFDASSVDPATVTLGDGSSPEASVAERGRGRLMASLEDVDGDGDDDLVLHFETQALVENGDLEEATSELEMNGETTGGTPIRGSDGVKPVGGRGGGPPGGRP